MIKNITLSICLMSSLISCISLSAAKWQLSNCTGNYYIYKNKDFPDLHITIDRQNKTFHATPDDRNKNFHICHYYGTKKWIKTKDKIVKKEWAVGCEQLPDELTVEIKKSLFNAWNDFNKNMKLDYRDVEDSCAKIKSLFKKDN